MKPPAIGDASNRKNKIEIPKAADLFLLSTLIKSKYNESNSSGKVFKKIYRSKRSNQSGGI